MCKIHVYIVDFLNIYFLQIQRVLRLLTLRPNQIFSFKSARDKVAI